MNGKTLTIVIIILALLGAAAYLLFGGRGRTTQSTPPVSTPVVPPVTPREEPVAKPTPSPAPAPVVETPAPALATAPAPTVPAPAPAPVAVKPEPVPAPRREEVATRPQNQSWIDAAYRRVLTWAPYMSADQREAYQIIVMSSLKPYADGIKELSCSLFSDREVKLIYGQYGEFAAGEDPRVLARIERAYQSVIGRAPYGRSSQREAYTIVVTSAQLPYEQGRQQLDISEFSDAEVQTIYGVYATTADKAQ